VQVQPVPAGDQAVSLVQVGAQLVGGSGLARVIAGGGDAAAERLAAVFKSSHIVALPAL
jgi:hypothetical protein